MSQAIKTDDNWDTGDVKDNGKPRWLQTAGMHALSLHKYVDWKRHGEPQGNGRPRLQPARSVPADVSRLTLPLIAYANSLDTKGASDFLIMSRGTIQRMLPILKRQGIAAMMGDVSLVEPSPRPPRPTGDVAAVAAAVTPTKGIDPLAAPEIPVPVGTAPVSPDEIDMDDIEMDFGPPSLDMDSLI